MPWGGGLPFSVKRGKVCEGPSLCGAPVPQEASGGERHLLSELSGQGSLESSQPSFGGCTPTEPSPT